MIRNVCPVCAAVTVNYSSSAGNMAWMMRIILQVRVITMSWMIPQRI